MINIRRDTKDPFYRYKMPKLIIKIEGKGNGVKTIIPNLPDIARALQRPPSYLMKYFGFELGAQVKIDEANGRYSINGHHGQEQLQSVLDAFIKKFVLCDNCANPETDMLFGGGNGVINRDCKGNIVVFTILAIPFLVINAHSNFKSMRKAHRTRFATQTYAIHIQAPKGNEINLQRFFCGSNRYGERFIVCSS
jgi:translation initiation factor 2 beta subunit (eIF-2beta)/eIF-5